MTLKYIKFLSLYIISVFVLLGCSNSRFSRSAIKAYEIGEYSDAINKYLKASRNEKDPAVKVEIDYYLANAYWRLDDYKKAELRLKNLINKQYPDSTLLLKYAHTLRNLEKYDEATSFYEKYLTIVPNSKEALNGIESCKITPTWQKSKSRYQVTREQVLNTRDADYSPFYIGGLDNSIVFHLNTRWIKRQKEKCNNRSTQRGSF
jgi:peptidoglycan-associated lipoprotein